MDELPFWEGVKEGGKHPGRRPAGLGREQAGSPGAQAALVCWADSSLGFYLFYSSLALRSCPQQASITQCLIFWSINQGKAPGVRHAHWLLAGAPAGYIFIHRNVFDFWAVAHCHRSPFFHLLFHFWWKQRLRKVEPCLHVFCKCSWWIPTMATWAWCRREQLLAYRYISYCERRIWGWLFFRFMSAVSRLSFLRLVF